MEGHSADDSPLARPMAAMTRAIIAYPWPTLAIGIGIALAATIYTTTNLGYRTSRLDLLNPKSDYNKLWIEYLEEFGEADDAVVVVEGAGREQVVPVLEELSRAISREDRLFHAVLHEVDLGNIRSKGLHYLSPDELLGIDQFLNEVNPILKGDWSKLNVGNIAGATGQRLAEIGRAGTGDLKHLAAQRDELERFCSSLLTALNQREPYRSPWPAMPQSFALLSELNSEYLLAKEGTLGFVLLRLAEPADKMGPNEATDVLRGLIRSVQARFPNTSIGLTGLPVMEDDEMRASQTSMVWASVISFVGVGLLFVSGFGGVRHALMANLILLVGMAWAFGYATASVGHLNILSVTFTATLIGIGIDFGIYFAARYIQYRKLGQPLEEALISTASTAGPSIITGALTTSIAFFAAGMTEFTGVSELGIIAGGGILLCAAAELMLLPAAIAIVDRTEWGRSLPDPLPVHRWIAPFVRLPRMTLAAGIAFTVFAALGLGKLWYDNNLLNMQAVGLESVELERKLLNECNQSVWYGLSIADTREELLARKAAFLKLPSVERTEEIVSMIPADHEIKAPIIRRIQQRLSGLPERPPLIPVERPEKVGAALGQLEEMLSMAGPGNTCVRQIGQIRDQLRRLPLADCYTLVSRFQQQMAGDLLSRLHTLRSIANPEPPRLTDLPASLVDRFVGMHGKHLLKIYGRGNIWDTQALESFVHDVRTVDPHVTGNPLQAYEASLEMKSSYQHAAIYSLLVIVGVLMLDFRNFRDVALAALPLAMGVVQTFGLMGILDIPINPANLIALPLILGLGVDYGVHIVHEFREHGGRYRMSPGTAVAVLTDSLTTIVGYGALMVATHQGLQSLGRVLTIGVTMCLFSSLVLLPALLTLVTRHRPELVEEPETSVADEPEDADSAEEIETGGSEHLSRAA